MTQLAEEQLAVGKRLINRRGTRVRRYVVETPVEENVNAPRRHQSGCGQSAGSRRI